MEGRNNGNNRIQLPEPQRIDTRKHTRQKTTGQNNSKGYHNSTERTSRTTMQKKWQQSLRIEIPWRQISGNLVHGIGTKKDTGPWIKNILHRNMRLDGNYTKARRVPCKSCGKGHENWDHFWKCKKYRPIWKKLCKPMNDTTEGETEEKIHRHYSRKWIYLGIKKDGNAISRGQALLHMIAWKFIIQKHTKSAIDGIPPKKINTGNIWKQILSRLVTRINAIQYKTERQRVRQEAKMEGFSLRNTNKKIEPFARIGEEIEWNETLKTELLELKLIKKT